MRTPHIQALKQQGGTLYTFAEANEDLTNLIIDSSKTFSFSKFVCLNLPDLMYVSGDSPRVDLSRYKGYDQPYTAEGVSEKFRRNLQNYILNFETYIINENNRRLESGEVPIDPVAESSFFNWLQEVGAIKFRKLTDDDKYTADGVIKEGEDYYAEEDGSNTDTDDIPNNGKIVKYIGSIDILNRNEVSGYAYTQIYLHIPSEAGSTPKIIFRSNPGGNFDVITDPDMTSPGNIIGTKSDDEQYLAYYDEEGTGEEDGRYKADVLYGIDFLEEHYYDIVNSAGINDFTSYNMSADAQSFEFNTVLLYYDLLDRSTGLTETKLYGILFLDNISFTGVVTNDDAQQESLEGVTAGFIQRYPKYKSSQDPDYINGNSYALKVELRVDTGGQTGDTYSISDESQLTGLNMFTDAMREMKKNTGMFTDLLRKYDSMAKSISQMSGIILALTDENAALKRAIASTSNSIKSYVAGDGIDITEESEDIERVSVKGPAVQTLYVTAADSTGGEETVVKNMNSWQNEVYVVMTMPDDLGSSYVIFEFDKGSFKNGKSYSFYFRNSDNVSVSPTNLVLKYDGFDFGEMISFGKDSFTLTIIDIETGKYVISM